MRLLCEPHRTRLNELEGVQASVNLATEKAAVRYDESSLDVDALLAAVEAAGYRASPAGEERTSSGTTVSHAAGPRGLR